MNEEAQPLVPQHANHKGLERRRARESEVREMKIENILFGLRMGVTAFLASVILQVRLDVHSSSREKLIVTGVLCLCVAVLWSADRVGSR